MASVLAMRLEYCVERNSRRIARSNDIGAVRMWCGHNARSRMHNKRSVGQGHRCKSGTNQKSAIGQQRNPAIRRMGIFIRPIEFGSNGVAPIELDINCHRSLFIGLGHRLSAHETHYVLATIGIGHDIQLWRFAGMVCHTRIHRSGRLFTTVHCRNLMDHHIRYNLCTSGMCCKCKSFHEQN